jgi:hypothetical protein
MPSEIHDPSALPGRPDVAKGEILDQVFVEDTLILGLKVEARDQEPRQKPQR